MALLDPNETNCIVQVLESSEQPEQQRSIYRVPDWVADPDLKRKAFQPQVVSFGPYHHGKDPLRTMEDRKCLALHQFLSQCGLPLDPFLESLREVRHYLEKSYDTLGREWKDSDRFLELMITDGSFMLEILRAETSGLGDRKSNISGMPSIMSYVWPDMLMLENQLPMLVLDRLVAVEGAVKDDEYINELILKYCFPVKPKVKIGKCLHLLDVVRKSLLHENPELDKGGCEDSLSLRPAKHAVRIGKCLHVPDVVRKSFLLFDKPEKEGGSRGCQLLQPATELKKHGIQLKNSKTGSLMNISFASGVLSLPEIMVEEATESMFLNLIAFERLHVGTKNEVSSYICFMDYIIDNDRDIKLLHSLGIVLNVLGSDEDIAKLFHLLAKYTTIEPSSNLNEVGNKVNQYCNKPMNRWKASLRQKYFESPWALLSLVGAIILFALTIIQTVYSWLSYNP